MFSDAYAAGFFDGEGWCVAAIRPNGLDYRVSIGQANRSVLDWFQLRYGGNVQANVDAKNKLTVKIMYRWTVTGEKAYKFMKVIFPYVIVKATTVELMLPIWEVRKDHTARAEAVKRFRERNKT